MTAWTEQPSVATVTQMMRASGADRLFLKRLSPNDNSKNQVYLGGDFSQLNVIPAASPVAATTGSHQSPIFKAAVTWGWLQPSGDIATAPNTQLILYPQYPEVRLSGFLLGARGAPSDVMTVRDEGRMLLIGVRPQGDVVAYAAAAGSSVANELIKTLPHFGDSGVLVKLEPDGRFRRSDPSEMLLAEICRVHRKGWIPGWALARDGTARPCHAPNCVGVTLESELGIRANGRSEPDYDGWEVKAFVTKNYDLPSGGPMTLMTPEPTGGFYREAGLIEFVDRYGYPDQQGRPSRRNFGGVHRVGEVCAATKLKMELFGYDSFSGRIIRSDGALVLLDSEGRVAASWDFASLLGHWRRKHRQAAYVPAERRDDVGADFRYGNRVLLAEGAEYQNLLGGFARGDVYYDPGIKVVRQGTVTTKRRNQFRVNRKQLPTLYNEHRVVKACVP